MTDTLFVEVPAELAEKMINEGFEEYVPFRSLAAEAGTIVTIASAGLSVGANFITILVSRDTLTEFLAAVRDWVQRKAYLQPGNKIEINISARKGRAESKVRIESISEDGIPQIDLDALETLIDSLFADDVQRGSGSGRRGSK